MKLQTLLAAAVSLSLAAFGDLNYYVVPPGTPGVPENPDYLSWATAGTNIHEAVYLAGMQHVGKTQKDTQHTLFVKSGFYLVTNQLYIGDCKTTIRSSKGPSAEMELDREGTILCGGYPATTNRIFEIAAESVSRAVKLRGLTITNGYGNNQAGAGVCFSDVNHTDTGLYDCTITNCYAKFASGGGVYAYVVNKYSLVISNCWVSGCVATNEFIKDKRTGQVGGAGLCIGQGGAANYVAGSRTSGIRVFDTVVSNNFLYGNAVQGTGLWIRNVGAWVERCQIVDNFGHTFVTGNQGNPGAVYSNGRYRLIDSVIKGNVARYATGGAGAYLPTGTLVSNCVFEANYSTTSAGNPPPIVYCCGDITTVQKVTYTNAVEVIGCTINGNCGSGVPLLRMAEGSIVRNCLFTGGTGYWGQNAAVGVYSTRTTFENNTVVRNQKGVLGGDKINPWFVNCIFDNTQNVHQVTLSSGYKGVGFSNCWICASSTTTQPKVGCLTMSRANAKLIDPENGDYRLQRRSPLRDAALKMDWMTGATDLDGNPRLLDKHGYPTASALPDIGCYECAIKSKGLVIVIE